MGVKILKFFDADLGSGMEKIRYGIRDKNLGSVTLPDPDSINPDLPYRWATVKPDLPYWWATATYFPDVCSQVISLDVRTNLAEGTSVFTQDGYAGTNRNVKVQ